MGTCYKTRDSFAKYSLYEWTWRKAAEKKIEAVKNRCDVKEKMFGIYLMLKRFQEFEANSSVDFFLSSARRNLLRRCSYDVDDSFNSFARVFRFRFALHLCLSLPPVIARKEGWFEIMQQWMLAIILHFLEFRLGTLICFSEQVDFQQNLIMLSTFLRRNVKGNVNQNTLFLLSKIDCPKFSFWEFRYGTLVQNILLNYLLGKIRMNLVIKLVVKYVQKRKTSK